MASTQTIKSILDESIDEEDDFDDHGGSSSNAASSVHVHNDADVDDDVDGGGVYYADRMMSRLSVESEGDDADVEPSDDEKDTSKSHRSGGVPLDDSDKDEPLSGVGMDVASLPGTPARAAEWTKEYASETEVRGRSGGGRTRAKRWLKRAWGMKKSLPAAEDGLDREAAASCRVLVPSGFGGSGRMYMDMEEVRACRDLGFELPADCTVEIPEAFSDLTADTSSGGNSPIANWRISSPGDDPKDVKARLKLWAQAVALTSASRLSG